MSRLLTAVFYKLKMMMNDRLLFLAMIVLPVLIVIASGYALRNEKLDIIPVAAVDEDDSASSRILLERLSGKDGIGLKQTTKGEAMAMLKSGRVEQAFVIRSGFERSIVGDDRKDLIEQYSAPSSHSLEFVRELLAAEAFRLITVSMAADNVEALYQERGIGTDGGFRDKVEAYTEGLWEPAPLMTVRYQELTGDTVSDVQRVTLPASSASSAGLLTAFMMFYLLFGSSWLVEERTNGTIKRLGSGSGALAFSFWGGVLALVTAGMLQVLLYSLIQRIAFGITLVTGVMSILVLFSYLLSVAAISMLLSALLKTQAQLQAVSPVLAMVTGFAGGCFWNFTVMPERIRQLSYLTPQGWALDGLNKLLLDPADLGRAVVPVLVLLASALILLPASYMIVKIQMRR